MASDDIILLGPQRLRPSLAQVIHEANLEGPIAAVTAGWQEREDEVDELSQHLGHSVFNLRLYRRAEKVFLTDPELWKAYRGRQDRLRRLQQIYRKRLDFGLGAVLSLLDETRDPDLLAPEIEEAIASVRRLDAHHLARVAQEREAFSEEWRPWERTPVIAQREGVAEILGRCRIVAIAGGHVAILLNRLRLFGLLELLKGHTVVAWSAGAMVLGPRVILFHDHPPQGAGNAEILEPGLSLYTGIVPLPHAHRRLRLDDRRRIEVFARRFAPDRCLAMEDGSWVALGASVEPLEHGVRELRVSGEVAA